MKVFGLLYRFGEMVVELICVGTELLLETSSTQMRHIFLKNVRSWDFPCTISPWSATMRSG